MKIYHNDQVCTLPDGKPNDFKSKDEAQKYLDSVLDKTVAMAARFIRNPNIEIAIRSSYEIR